MGPGGLTAPPGDVWLTLAEFEAHFWSEGDKIAQTDPKRHSHGSFFAVQHPSRSKTGPGEKHTNEWLPTLILGKSESGKLRNWARSLHLSVSWGSDRTTEAGHSYDVAWRFEPMDPNYGRSEGYLEITRGLSVQASRELIDQDMALSKGQVLQSSAKNFDDGIATMLDEVVGAIERKATLARAGRFPPQTVLLVWLRQELNFPYARQSLSTAEFLSRAAQAAQGAFEKVCVVGMAAGVIWLLGDGLG